MSGMRLPGTAWTGEALTAEAKAAHLRASRERADDIAATNRAFRRAGWWVGAAGAAVGLAGMASATATILQWRPADPVYAWIDPRTGEIKPAPRAIDAVQHFTEGTARQHLRMYLDYCEAYLFQTARMTSTRCQLFLSPAQRERFVAWFNAGNPESPQARFGRTGSASIADNVGYTLVGTGRDGAQVWQMTFTKVIAEQNQRPQCVPWISTVTFQWRPDLKMSEADRAINLAGMQVVERRSTQDAVRRPEC